VRARGEIDAGAFAVVMATGILGVGARLEGIAALADVLLAIACLGWLVLAGLLGTSSIRSFAVVAGTAVIGADLLLADEGVLALALWSLAAALWVCAALALRREALRSLLLVVAVESLAVLAAALDRRHVAALRAVALLLWAAGLALYPLVAGPIVHAALQEREFSPTLWIVMGALAITTLAAAELLLDHGAVGDDVALATWAAASALIPCLLLVELLVRRWRYEAARWSFVFPLAMYGVASRVLGSAGGLAGLRTVGTIFFWIALVAWVLTAAGLARRPVASLVPLSARGRDLHGQPDDAAQRRGQRSDRDDGV
jgi:tellurite resistance protein TehA-like permease